MRLVKTPGLAGVNNKIVGTFAENLVYATDMESDEEDMLMVHDRKTGYFSFIASWNSGVAYYFPNHITLGTIAAS